MTDDYQIDGQKLHYHPQRVAQLLDAEGDVNKLLKIYPVYVEISPVGACNHRCKFCAVDYIGYQTANRLETCIFERMIPELAEGGVKSVMYAGEGEPLLHKDISYITRMTKESGIDVSFTTNAVAMTEKFIENAIPYTSWVKASVNAGSKETYAQVHATKEKDFARVIANLSRAVAYRDNNQLDCVIGLQSLLLPDNEKEMPTLAKIARDEVGADYLVVKPYSQGVASLTSEYKDINYELDKYKKLEAELKQFNTSSFTVNFRAETMRLYHENTDRRYTKCYSTPLFLGYIMANGSVYGCNDHLFDDRFKYGNINEDSFKDIWEGALRRKNLEFVLNDLDVSTCRVNCRMDKVNRYLDAVVEKKVQHVNFI